LIVAALRRVKPLVLAAVTTTAAACSGAGAGLAAPPTPDEQQSLRTLRSQLSGPSVASEMFADGDAHHVAIAVMKQQQDPAIPEVDIYRWDRGWHSVAEVTLDVGGSVTADAGDATPIRIVDLTPAQPPELVVTVHYNAGPASAVLSKFGGAWHALTFHGGLTRDGDERFAVRIHPDGTVTSQENDCLPNCAQGHAVTTAYRFSAATGRLDAYTNR
jgi:hypothetical protein